jgi:hypothetical protein
MLVNTRIKGAFSAPCPLWSSPRTGRDPGKASEPELGEDPGPDLGLPGGGLFVVVDGVIDADPDDGALTDLLGEIEAGSGVSIPVLGAGTVIQGVVRGDGAHEAAEGHVQLERADLLELMVQGSFDHDLVEVEAVVRVKRGLEEGLGQHDAEVDLVLIAELGEALGAVEELGAGRSHPQETGVDHRVPDGLAQAVGVGALKVVGVEESGIGGKAAEAGNEIFDADLVLDEAVLVRALLAAEDVLGLPGEFGADGEVLGELGGV